MGTVMDAYERAHDAGWTLDPTRVWAASRCRFLGVDFDVSDLETLVDWCLHRSESGGFASLVTPNADHVVRIVETGGEVARAYANASLCVNDSRVIELVARFVGVTLPAVPGADLVKALFQRPNFCRDRSMMLVGGDERQAGVLGARHGVRALCQIRPPMGLATDPQARRAVAEQIEADPCDVVFLAVGSPQQELIAEMLRRRGRYAGLVLCVGAGLEFLTGTKPRAPQWLSGLRLEWLFRMLTEPRRLAPRYVALAPRFCRLLVREYVRRTKVALR
jgi:exopolysaccharide biosynthesis WecB/TagA/CpsF family protein